MHNSKYKKIVYIVSAMYYPSGMAKILTEKMNWLAKNTQYEIWMVETERADLPHYYPLNPNIKSVNFDINFDSVYALPFFKRILAFKRKEHSFKKELTHLLINIRPDITISTMRREINFINKIHDGSQKIGEIHFGRSHYRIFNKSFFPTFLNRLITTYWQHQLLKEIKRLKRFVVLTHEDAACWPELKNLEIIPNFIPSIPKKQSTCKNKQVIALGRYTEQKGFDLLIDAWKIVESKHSDWKIDLYGSGDKDLYQKMADEKGLKNMKCHSSRRNLEDIYTTASIYVLSSRHEGFGLVLIEAMSYGVPCVSFACPCGPKDIISHNINGLLVKNGDVNDLAANLKILIENQTLRQKLGTQAKKDVQQWEINSTMQKWVYLFSSVT